MKRPKNGRRAADANPRQLSRRLTDMSKKCISMSGKYAAPMVVCAAVSVLVMLIGILCAFFPGMLYAIAKGMSNVLLLRILVVMVLTIPMVLCAGFCCWMTDLIRRAHLKRYGSGIFLAVQQCDHPDPFFEAMDEMDDMGDMASYDEYADLFEDDDDYAEAAFGDVQNDDDSFMKDPEYRSACIRMEEEMRRREEQEASEEVHSEDPSETDSETAAEAASEDEASEESYDLYAELDRISAQRGRPSEEGRRTASRSGETPRRRSYQRGRTHSFAGLVDEDEPLQTGGYRRAARGRAVEEARIASFDRVIEREGRMTLRYTRSYVMSLVSQVLEEADRQLWVRSLNVNLIEDAVEVDLSAYVKKNADHQQIIEQLYADLRETLGTIAQSSQILLSLTVCGVIED